MQKDTYAKYRLSCLYYLYLKFFSTYLLALTLEYRCKVRYTVYLLLHYASTILTLQVEAQES